MNVPIEKIRIPSASDVLADKLREQILSGVIPLGSALPAERELIAQTGLSRFAVRKAIQLLEIEGLVRTRTGRNGGAYVTRPPSDQLVYQIDLYLRGRQVRLTSVLEVRSALEPLAAAFAAERRTPEALEKLEELTVQVEQAASTKPLYFRRNAEWHQAIAAASGNELLASFMAALSQVIEEGAYRRAFNSDEMVNATLKAHRRILDAIRAGDSEAAARRMARHVGAALDAIVRSESHDEAASSPMTDPRRDAHHDNE